MDGSKYLKGPGHVGANARFHRPYQWFDTRFCRLSFVTALEGHKAAISTYNNLLEALHNFVDLRDYRLARK